MKGRVIYLLYALLAIGAAFWLYQQWAGEERRILRRLDEMRDLIEKGGGENDLIAANKARQLGEMFADEFALHLTPIGETVTDRQRLMQVALQYRRQHDRIGLDFRDRELTVAAGSQQAEMLSVAHLGAWRDGGRSQQGFRLRLLWQQRDSVWSIRELEVLEVLEGTLFGL